MNSKKAITLLVLTTMLLAMVPLAPVSGATVPYIELKARGAATSDWVTAPAIEDYSVKLFSGVEWDFATVYLWIDPILLSSLTTDPSYWVLEPVHLDYHPYVNIFVDLDGINPGEGAYDVLEGIGDYGGTYPIGLGYGDDPEPNTWTEMISARYYDGDNSMLTGFTKINDEAQHGGGATLAEWKAALVSEHPDAVVYKIGMGFGSWNIPDITAYVDDIKVGGVTYPLEPQLIADAGGPYSGVVGSPVRFDGSGSYDPAGTIDTYDWAFGDGTYSDVEKPSHTYDDSGTYNVKLIVTGTSGTDSEETTATITGTSGFSSDRISITNDDKTGWDDRGEKGHLIILEGDKGSVASGYEVLVYWDKMQDWDGEKGFLNTTDADDDGGFEVWFDVPEADVGNHYLWFEATDREGKVSKAFTVVSDCDISTSSGLQGAKIYVDLWGFAKNKEIAILFVEKSTGYPPYSLADFGIPLAVHEDLEETVDPDEDDYDGTLEEDLIMPGTFVLDIGGDFIDDDDGTTPDGNLFDANDDDVGSINYVTGEWNIDLGDSLIKFTPSATFYANYKYFKDDPGGSHEFYVITTAGVTNDLGSWEDRRITIPDDALEKQYYVVGMDGKNNQAYDDFKIGATITLSEDECDVGDVITIEGEGFMPDDTVMAKITVDLIQGATDRWECHIIDSEGAPYVVDADGDFEIDIVVPMGDNVDDNYDIEVNGIADTITYKTSADFEITGLAEVTVNPEFGPQGSRFTVSGVNFPNINDAELVIELYKEDAGAGTADFIVEISDDAETDSDGSFEIDVRVPTEPDKTYEIRVTAVADDDGGFDLWKQTEFRIGTVLVLLSEDEGRVGQQIVLTGNGFEENGEWNATFGDVVIFEDETIDEDGRLDMGGKSPEFFVPQLQPGEYMITVWDVEAELSVEVDFTVTEYISLVLESYNAPNEYNVTFEAFNWPEVDGDLNSEDEIEFVLWNDTDDWDMDVLQRWQNNADTTDKMAIRTAQLNETGFMVSDPEEYGDAYWIVPDDDVLDRGCYWINATLETTNDQEFFVQLEFCVGDVHKAISPRKATFRIGDTVTFNIEHTFGDDINQDILGGDLKIYDPDGTLYWAGDDLDTWSQVETWFEVPYSAQTAGGNPMNLLDDAPIGPWSYKWRESDGDTLLEGTFNVEASEADILVDQINDINQAIDDLTDDITGVTDAIAGVQTNVNSAVQAANAAVDAANKAIEAVNAGVAQSAEAAAAAERAEAAAGKAQDAAGGLTTLVYGAIGASLVAALAAIVSLMQISRRIAG